MNKSIFALLFFLYLSASVEAQKKGADLKPQPPIVFKDGTLHYAIDSLGNRVPDFSYAGYRAGEVEIPTVLAQRTVPLVEGDATALIQEALNQVGALKPDANGFRGAVLLQRGTYHIGGSLLINRSGVVLRGDGAALGGTQLLATGTDRRTLIKILGVGDPQEGKPIQIIDQYLPVNARVCTLAAGHTLKVGDQIFINRPSTQAWIKELGTDQFGGGISALGWKPDDHTIQWDRTVVAITGNQVEFDVPITTAMEQRFGGGFVTPYTWAGRVSQVGIENIACVSEYDPQNSKDEAHAWTAISLEKVTDAWVRNVTCKHFAGSAVAALATAKRVTVENCKSLQPISEVGGQRRQTFYIAGQQCLFQRLYAEQGYHDFGFGFCAAGPNAFVQCFSQEAHSFSGAIESWASGALFDIVQLDINALSFKNRGQSGRGVGWSAANSLFWQCTASLIECPAPPTAQNWSFGSWAQFEGNGYWGESNNYIQPRSLYYQQLQQRLGRGAERACLLPVETEASSSPSIEVAAELTKRAAVAPITLSAWIDSLQRLETGTFKDERTVLSVQTLPKQLTITPNAAPLQLVNGVLTRDHAIQIGARAPIQWWNGSLRPPYLKSTAKPHLTRFVPSRTGTGLTDDLNEVVSWMKQNQILTLDHNYGLWYDRRRDDHERIRRIDADVWAPFYEQPFARSGEGTAYDGLSRYDLTKYNVWYWNRLSQFATLADANGLLLFNQHYFQHNIIEAGAHWADSPWRPANNVNNTGFPEPAPYAGEKRIFLAEQFYDITHPIRRELHRAFIRQSLNNFKTNSSVIHFISEEFTGPLHFVTFWIDEIAAWSRETGVDPLVALSVTKEEQDAILSDSVRAKTVDLIDIRYWFTQDDSTFYAPKGGQNLAPRQHARLTKPGKVSFESVYQSVLSYRMAYPNKAVSYFATGYEQYPWAVLLAGGSLAQLPALDKSFRQALSFMRPMPSLNTPYQYVMGDKSVGYLIFSPTGEIKLPDDLRQSKYLLYDVDMETGAIQSLKSKGLPNPSFKDDTVTPKSSLTWVFKKLRSF